MALPLRAAHRWWQHAAREGRAFFVGTSDGTTRVFDFASGRVVRQFALRRPVKRFGGFQFARADDAVFAARFDYETGPDDNTAAVFDIATGKPIAPSLPAIKPSPNDAAISDSVGLTRCRLSIYGAKGGHFRITISVQTVGTSYS